MIPGQERFREFVLGLVEPGQEPAADAILRQSFAAQEAAPLTPEQIDQAVAQLTPLLKPGRAAHLQNAAARMKEMGADLAARRDRAGHDGEHHDHHGDHMVRPEDDTWARTPAPPDQAA